MPCAIRSSRSTTAATSAAVRGSGGPRLDELAPCRTPVPARHRAGKGTPLALLALQDLDVVRELLGRRVAHGVGHALHPALVDERDEGLVLAVRKLRLDSESMPDRQ